MIIGANEFVWRRSSDAATEAGDREWQYEHDQECVFIATQVFF
jgi:hypothetical protein